MPTSYKVQYGDSAESIAHHQMGDARRAQELVVANPRKFWAMNDGQLTFRDLHVGERLRVPSARDVGLGAGGDALDEANALDGYLTSNGCDCSSALQSVTRTFQSAFNSAIDAGSYSGSKKLTVDGKYGPMTRDALAVALGGPAQDACWGAGGKCAARPAPGKPAAGGGTKPGGVIPVSNMTHAGGGNMMPWLIAGTAVVAGAGLVYAVQKRKKRGAMTRGRR